MFLAPLPMVYIYLAAYSLQEYAQMLVTLNNNGNQFSTAKLLKQGYR